ncbi:MAG TPA: DUF4412 domain-containing protein [Rudaea sp.]|jgi:hypothetical protein|nr:DUF4412 domain-containing protein [Rudaea sp.]
MHLRFSLSIAVLGCALSGTALADFRAEYAIVKGGSASDMPGMSRIELGDGRLRTDAGNVSMLVDTRSGKMTVLMHDKHQYMDMQKVVDTAAGAMAQANAALANLPPEQRAMIEERMGGKIPGMGAKMDVSVTPTGASDRVAGYACQVYRTQVGGEHIDDICLANVADAGISGADQATVRKAFEEMRTMTEKMSGGMFRSPLASMPLDKFPVRMTHYDDSGNVRQVVQLKSVQNGGVSGGDFAIPPGYTEQDMPSLGRHR